MIYVVKCLEVNNCSGGRLGDIEYYAYTKLFKNKDDAKNYLKEQYDSRLQDILDQFDFEDEKEFLDTGYGDAEFSETRGYISSWDDCDEGVVYDFILEELELN